MNPFNQSRFRNEHTLGDSYQIVKDVHDKMDIIKMVADNISNFRSGNIELKGEGALIQWKYTEGTEWFLLMDTMGVFFPILQDMTSQAIASIEEDIVTLTSDIAGNALSIERINTEASALELRVTELTAKSVTAASDIISNTEDIAQNASAIEDVDMKASALELRVADLTTQGITDAENIATNTSDIAAINAELVDIKTSITALEGAVSVQATTLSGILTQLDTLEGSVTAQGLSIVGITDRVTALESV